ncbi:hypothetical protein RJT34_12949 [Clitoria ternatea]|uniref:Uncharacterized protein n=1 Tax=Clitoria ternatea TaxID=43366 RepID=A0AAN9JMP3_CLITE
MPSRVYECEILNLFCVMSLSNMRFVFTKLDVEDKTSSRVRVAALKLMFIIRAVGSFLEFTHDGDEVIKFCEFIPSILNVSRQCLASGEEDIAIISSEIFDELIESPVPLLGDLVKSTPEIISLYESILPCILNALEDASNEVKETSYYALAAFYENMGEEILPFLDSLMGRLFTAVTSQFRIDIDEHDDEIANGFRGVSSNDEAHDEPRVQNISITTGVSDDKAAATQALGLFAQHTKTYFAPYPLT